MAISANDAAAHHAATRTPLGGVRGQTILPGTTGRGSSSQKACGSKLPPGGPNSQGRSKRRGHPLGEALQCAHAYARGAEPAAPLQDYDPLACDAALDEALQREGAAWAKGEVGSFARATATREAIGLGFDANQNPPRLRTHDRFGHRIDEVDFHPAWHELMRLSVANGVHCGPWRDPGEGAHVARAAKMFLVSQTEAGHGCPLSMTYSAFPALRHQADLLEEWAPRIVSLEYDSRALPAAEKRGALIGMGMTEKQGGSDVRANTTRADPLGGGAYALTGHKWFCSAPMSDAFLVLAQAPRGLSCFLVPRWKPDGERNGFHLQRLKDKLGNRSNASSEVELDRAWRASWGRKGAASDHPGDGEPHPARLRDRRGGDDAPGPRAGGSSLRAPDRLRAAPDRAAADARGPCRSGRGIGGRDGPDDAPGARI